MSLKSTAEEIHQQYITDMQIELGMVFYSLHTQFCSLRLKWLEDVVLFGTDEGRIDLLNQAAPAYFYMLEKVLWDDIVLHICRLTDPIAVAGRETLTLRRLAKLVKDELRDEIERQLTALIEVTRFARDWRNRHIGHTDLALVLECAQPLAPASRQSINDALGTIAALLNRVASFYSERPPVYYDLIVPGVGSAESLLFVLRNGVAANARRQ